MQFNGFKAQPISRKQIRQIVKMIKRKCGLEKVIKFQVCDFFKFIMGKLFPDFEWEIRSKKEMPEEGLTFPAQKKIDIREDVYKAACRGDGRARFTIMHEIGHLILHNSNKVALCRLSAGERLRAFEDPEWQANTFASEFLMDKDLVLGMNPLEISKACGVSRGAAQARIDILMKERN